MQLYLITHAATAMSKTTDATRWSLSPAGEVQTLRLAEQPFWDDVDQIVLSSEPKTHLTVGPVLAARHLPVFADARLDELRRAGWVDDYSARVRRAFAQPTVAAGEWESAASALARVNAAIEDLVTRFGGQTVALVGHGLTLSLYRAQMLGRTTVDYEDWRCLSFAAVALVDPIAQRLLRDFEAVAGTMPRG